MDQQMWENYTSCCRLCLDDAMGSLRSIFEDVISGNELVQQILTYIGIEVKIGDKLSTMICDQCLTKLHGWNSYKKSCFENQGKLKDWMNLREANNVTTMEIQIKQEVMDQSYESVAMEEESYIEPSVNLFLSSMDENQSVTNKNHSENGLGPTDEDAAETEINRNNKYNKNEINSTICSFCEKCFSNPFNRRRHERDVHERKSVFPKKEPLDIFKMTNNEADDQKIQFAAGLQLKQRSAQHTSIVSGFTEVEITYLERFKNIITMTDTLICVCHNEKFESFTDVFDHLKRARSWFAVFTCYNCLIGLSDRGSYLRHYCSCTNDTLLNTRRLSECTKNTETKIRIYQNFKCLKCHVIFSFYEDFCNHLDEKHMEIEDGNPPYTCICNMEFDDAESLKTHINVMCFVLYYCDVCFTCYSTIDAFENHCIVEHDQKDGSSLELYDYYHKTKHNAIQPRLSGKERRICTRRQTLLSSASSQPDLNSPPVLKAEVEPYTPKPSKVINPHAFKHSSQAAACPECDKIYSSYHNMLRHYTIAHDETGLILACQHCPERFRLISELKEHESLIHEIHATPNGKSPSDKSSAPKFSCPDCNVKFSTSAEWKKHIELHPKQKCEECGKQFNLQCDLEQHRSVHLNIKLYRDSETQNYKSATLGCSVCEVFFATKEELKQHKSLHEKMPELSIQDGSILEESKDNITEMSYTEEVVKEFPKKCPDCDKVIQTKGAYGNHVRMHQRLMGLKLDEESTKSKVPKTSTDESESYYTCKKCFKVFSRKYNLKNHMKCHGINLSGNRNSSKSGKVLKTFWCDICHQACLGYAELQEHKLEHRQSKPKAVSTVSEANLAQQSNNPFIFICDICSSSFSTSFALKRHREKHDQEVGKQNNGVIYCKHCKIPFANTKEWNKHMENEHDEGTTEFKNLKMAVKTYSCKICKKHFDNGGALASHQGWHKRGNAKKVLNEVIPIKSEIILQKPKVEITAHKCNSCALQFVNETALQIHILETHRNITRVLQLNCISCQISFESKIAYDTHMQFHKVVASRRTPSKPFACKYCPSRFSRKDRLRGHLKLHHNDHNDITNVFNCTKCNRSFDKQSALIIHLKVHERHSLSTNEILKPTPKSTPDKNLYFCSICDLGFAIPKDLRTHVITAHPF